MERRNREPVKAPRQSNGESRLSRQWYQKSFAAWFAIMCAGAPLSGTAWGQGYPVRPVRLVIASSIGSGVDILGRVVVDEMSQVLGQQLVVDNRPGAGTNIAMEIVAKALPDGYTLLLIPSSLAANVSLYRNLPFDPVRDFAPITQLATLPSALCVHPGFPAKSVKELIQIAKAKPGAINYASAGAGAASFLAAEFFKSVAGIDLVHVPYKGGGPALNALVAGEVLVMFAPASSCAPAARQGRVRLLAVTGASRVPSIPEVPTVAEAGLAGYKFENWYGFLAPARTPRGIVAKVHAAVVSVLRKPNVSARLSDLGYAPVGDRPEEFAAYIKSEIAKLGKIIREAGVTAN